MGQFVAAAASSLGPVVSSVLGFLGDNAQTIQSMKQMIDGFQKESHAEESAMLALSGLAYSRAPLVIDFADDAEPTSAQSAAKAALNQATTSVSTFYKARFPNVPAGDAEGGFVTGFKPDGDASTAVAQMSNYFQINDLPTTNDPQQKMVKTIQVQMAATQGLIGKTPGKTILNANQSICWAVMYGTVAGPDGRNALLYGFIAGFDSGFGA